MPHPAASPTQVASALGASVDDIRPAVLDVPLRVRTRNEVTLLMNEISFTPGTVALELCDHHLYVHALSTGDPLPSSLRSSRWRTASWRRKKYPNWTYHVRRTDDDHNDSGTMVVPPNHAHVLLCIADDPSISMGDVADKVGIAEGAAQRIVAELEAGGYLSHEKVGRRNRYQVHSELSLLHPLEDHFEIGARERCRCQLRRKSTFGSHPSVEAVARRQPARFGS